MYILKNNDGSPRPCAIVPPASIANLDEAFERLDAGEPCRGIAMVGDDEVEFDIPEEYALNSLGRKTRIGGNELFAKRLRQDLAYLARYEWGRAHTWNEDELGAWNDAVGVPRDETPVDPVIEARLRPVFPESDIAGILARYATRRRWAPTPDAGTLIRILLNEERNMPMRRRRPAKSGIALEVRDTEYGEMGVARDKRTGQTWMWPMDEERRFSPWSHNADMSNRLDRRDIKSAFDEELQRGGLPESFDHPCRTSDGEIVWCRWDGLGDQDREEYPIMAGGMPDARKVGTLARLRD